MRKIATITAGTALAAGIALVPAAGFASAATTHSAATHTSVTQVHPRGSIYGCIEGGGEVLFIEPGYGICVGGWEDGQPVWW
jgi:hypothetical protein